MAEDEQTTAPPDPAEGETAPEAAPEAPPAPAPGETPGEGDDAKDDKDTEERRFPVGQAVLGGVSATTMAGFWAASVWGPWAVAGVAGGAAAAGGWGYMAYRRRRRGGRGGQMWTETRTQRTTRGASSGFGMPGLGRRGGGGSGAGGSSVPRGSAKSSRAAGSGGSLAGGSPRRALTSGVSRAGGASAPSASARPSAGSRGAPSSGGRSGAGTGRKTAGAVGGSSGGSSRAGWSPFSSRKPSGGGSGGGGSPSGRGSGGGSAGSGRRGWRKHSTPPGDGGMPNPASSKGRARSGSGWGRTRGGTGGSGSEGSGRSAGAPNHGSKGGGMKAPSRGVPTSDRGRFGRAVDRIGDRARRAGRTAGRWVDGKTGRRASTGWAAAKRTGGGFWVSRRAAKDALKGRRNHKWWATGMFAFGVGIAGWGRSWWHRAQARAGRTLDATPDAQPAPSNARSGSGTPATEPGAPTTPETEPATPNPGGETAGTTPDSSTSGRTTTMAGLPHAQMAADMAAINYEPVDAFTVVDESQQWPDAVRSFALSIRSYAQRLETARFPLSPDSLGRLEALYEAIAKTVPVAEDIHPGLARDNEVDMARRDNPRGDETKWNVS